ncbi:hypothetical protein HOY80DRAFT_897618, partial [Tuber brumale]
KLSIRLMKSKIYQISAFNYIHKNWQRFYRISRVNSILNKLQILIDNRAVNIKFKRVYIPKNDNK